MSHVSRFTSHVTRHSPLVTHLIVYATVLVAFFLRVYRLADKNVWWDEGWSIWLSQKDLAWIALRTAADEHPPLHYWMLHFWNSIAGTNAFAGRFLSVAFGVLTIALIYRIGKRVGARPHSNSPPLVGEGIGVLAALFLATARFNIWWSQDIKNYTPSIFFAFAAVWFMLDVIEKQSTPPSPPLSKGRVRVGSEIASHKPLATLAPHASAGVTIIAYAICAALAMWTHYLAALVLLALNLYVFIILTRAFYVSPLRLRSGQGFTHHASPDLSFAHWSFVIRNWLIGNFLAAAFFVPWLFLYLQNAVAWTAAPAFDFILFLKLVATVLPLGVTTNIDNYAALTIALTVIAALGAISQQSTVNSQQSPQTERRSLFTVHCTLFTLIVLLPPLLVYALSLTPVAFFAPKIQARYLLILLPAYTILLALGVIFLSRFSRPFAVFAILIVLGANAFVLNDYYSERRLRDEYTTLANTINSFARQGDLVLLDTDQEWPTVLYYLRYPLDWLGAPNGKPMTAADADALVRRATNRNDAIWLITIPDALATDPQKLLEMRLARDLPKRFDQTFDGKRLVLYARDDRDLDQVARENFVPQFARSEQVNDDLQLLGFDLPVREARAGDWVRVVTYWNARAASQVIVTSQTIRVPQGERVRVQTDLVAPPNLRGDFVIALGVQEIARVRVEPHPEFVRPSRIAFPLDARFGDTIHCAGYDLSQAIFRPGDTVPLTLYWRAERPIEKSYTVFVHLVGAQFNPKHSPSNPLWGQVDRAPTPPTTAWLTGEIVPDAYRIAIDADAPPGKYQVVIGMYDAATGARLSTESGDSISITEIEIGP